MKNVKWVAVLLVLVLTLGMGSVYAQTAATTATTMRQTVGQRPEVRGQVDVLAKVAQVRQNHTTIKELHQTLRTKLAQIKQEIKDLKENPDLTEEQVQELKEKLRLVVQNRRSFGATNPEIRAEALKVRASRLERNMEGALTGLDNVLKIQQNRIDLLKKLNADADAILELLK